MKRYLAKVVILSFLAMIALLLTSSLTASRGQKQSHFNGKEFANGVKEIMPKCWSPAKKLLLRIGCSSFTSETRAEMAMLLTSCLFEVKRLRPIICNIEEFRFCQHGKCLVKCGLENGEKVAETFGYNPFQVIHDAIPEFCKYFLSFEHVNVKKIDWTEVAEDLRLDTTKNLKTLTYTQVGTYHLTTIRELFYGLIEDSMSRGGGSGGDLDEIASSPSGFAMLFLLDLFIIMVILFNL